jgi:hypothetical protein
MNTKQVPFLIRLRRYQQARFPVLVLVISLIPAILSSSAVTIGTVSVSTMITALIVSVSYLLHIRIIDEHRDFEHDNHHYKNRPVQQGVVTKQELRSVDGVLVGVILGLPLISSISSLVVAFSMLAYSWLCGREFFLGERLRTHFFLYNSVNLVQMLLMQVWVYSLFAGTLSLTPLLILHFLFTSVGTIVFEFMRKVKIPGSDGTGKDTYTYYLGFSRSLLVYVFLGLLSLGLWVALLTTLGHIPFAYMLIGILGALSIFGWTYAHYKKRTLRTEQGIQGSYLILYGALNLIIYIAII